MTPLNVKVFRKELINHPNKSFVEFILTGIQEGFKIGFEGGNGAYHSNNMKSVALHPEVIRNYVEEEVEAGRVLGPFSVPPLDNFRCSPIGVVEKKEPGKFRTIMNLSFPSGLSVNDGIQKDKFSLSYVTVDNAIDIILSLGPGCLLTKIDIQKAFRQVPVHPSNWNLLGFSFNNAFYIDRVLSMGGRSSPAIFNSIAVAAEWICCNNYHLKNMIHLLDDFLLVEVSSTKKRGRDVILGVFERLGLIVNKKKVEGPTTCIEFLGITLDTVNMEARVSKEKIVSLNKMLISFQERKKCSQRELLSLVGSLSFVSRVVVPGRSFLSRLIAKAYSVKKLHHKIYISGVMKRDCNMWRKFLRDWNGKSLFLSRDPVSIVHEFSTDAAGSLGCAGVHRREWFSLPWGKEAGGWSIAVKELYPIVVASQLWGRHWRGLRVVVRCDNASVVAALNKCYSNNRLMADLLRALTLYSLKYNFSLKAKHIPGKLNRNSDLLSRLQVDTFLRENPLSDKVGQKIKGDPLRICRDNFGS